MKKLISLEIYNFRNLGYITLDFSDKITVIKGTNGVGKTTIIEAVTFALFGSKVLPHTIDSLIRVGTKKGYVKLTFENVEGNQVKVSRFLGRWDVEDTRKEVVQTEVNGVRTKHRSNSDNQDFINSLVGVSAELFHANCSIGAGILSFAKNANPQKKTVMDDLVGVGSVDVAGKSVKERLKNIENERQELVVNKNTLEVQIKSYSDQLQKYSQVFMSFDQQQATNILQLKETIETLEEDNKDFENSLRKHQQDIDFWQKAIENCLAGIKTINAEFETKKQVENKHIEKLENCIQQVKVNLANFESQMQIRGLLEADLEKLSNSNNTHLTAEEQESPELVGLKKELSDLENFLNEKRLEIPEWQTKVELAKHNLLEVSKPYTCTYVGCGKTFDVDADVVKLASENLENLKGKLATRLQDITKTESQISDLKAHIKQVEQNIVIARLSKQRLVLQAKLEKLPVQEDLQKLQDTHLELSETLNTHKKRLYTIEIQQNDAVTHEEQQIKKLQNAIDKSGYEIKNLSFKIDKNQKHISETKEKIEHERRRVCPISKSQMQELERTISDFQKQILLNDKRLKELEELEKPLQFWKKGLGSAGLKSYIYEAKFQKINEIFKQVAKETGVLTNLEIKKNYHRSYEIWVKFPYNAKPLVYSSLSQGEKQICDVLIPLAFREIKSLPFIFLDEILDNLTEENQEKYLTYVRKKVSNLQTIFISHSLNDKMDSHADTILELVRDSADVKLLKCK